MDVAMIERADLDIETPRVYLPLLQPKRYKGAYGGRGSTKSHFFAGSMVEDHVSTRGLRSVCIREIQRSLDQSVKQLIEDKIRAFRAQRYFTVKDKWIESHGGGVILFEGMQNHTADSIKSLEGFRRAWVEEAQNLSRRSWDLLYPTIRAPGSEIWCSWNPVKPTDPVDEFFRKDPPHNAISVQVNWQDNPWFRQTELYADMLRDRERDPDRYAHIWGGGYQVMSEARVFKRWRIGTGKDFAAPDKVKRWYLGLDFGFAADPCACLRISLDPKTRTLYIWREGYQRGVEIDHLPAWLLSHLGEDAFLWPLTADSARPESISYLKRKGWPRVKASRKGAGSVEDGVEFLKGWDIVVHPKCTHTIDELTYYAYKIDSKSGEVLPVLIDAKNHIIDATRYALEDERKPRYGVY